MAQVLRSHYENFDVRIEKFGESYRTRVSGESSGECTAPADPSVALAQLDGFLFKVGQARRRSRGPADVRLNEAKKFGAILFESAFRENALVCLQKSLAYTAARGDGMRIRLHLAELPELSDLRWEFLYNEMISNGFFSLSERTPLVRYLDFPDSIRPLDVVSPLRILVVISSPTNYPQLDVEQEWKTLKDTLADLEKKNLVVLERLDTPRLAALPRALRKNGGFHILHFIGHGEFDDHGGALVFEDERQRGKSVSAEKLGTVLHDQLSLRLVVLNACEGARASRTDPFSGTAQTLVRKGIPAVLAMQFEITDDAAINFTSEFYSSVAVGDPIDAALAHARLELYALQDDGVEWATPVLHMRAPDGRIFELAQEQVTSSDSAQHAAGKQEDKATTLLGNPARKPEPPEIGRAASGERQRLDPAERVQAEGAARLAEVEAPHRGRLFQLVLKAWNVQLMIRWVSGILLLLAIGGGARWYLSQDPLQTALDRRWPPVIADNQRQAAINSAASALQGLAAPNLAAGVDSATIQRIALKEVKSKGVTKLTVATDRQLLRMTADFDLTLTPDDLPRDSNQRPLVASLTPHVAGEVELFLTAVASVSDAPQRALLVKLVPAVNRIRIDKLTVNGSYDVAVATDAIALLLDRYAGNLTAALSASPFLIVTLPSTFQDVFDPSGPVKLDVKEAPGLKPTIASHPIKSPFRLGAAALLIDGDKVAAVAELVPLDQPPARSDPVEGSFEDVKAAFTKYLKDGLGIVNPPAGFWAALGKALAAEALDSAFAQAQPCLDALGAISRETFSVKIPTPDDTDIDCAPTRDCTPTRECTPIRDCTPSASCDLQVDQRDCSICLIHNIFTGGCSQRGNDPVCEAAKAAQNTGYAAAKASCEAQKSAAKADCERIKGQDRLDCERLKTQDKAQCEAEKEGQRLACETRKDAIVALHRTGNIGNVEGSVAGTSSLRLCFENVHFSAALDKLSLTLAASGSAALNTHFQFVPLDVGGHILCPFEWTADKNITTSVPPQSIGANVTLARETDGGALAYRGRLDELPMKLHFQPSPLSLVLQNVNFDLACPVTAGLTNGLNLGLAPFIPEFLKDYTYKLAPLTFSFAPDLPAASILGHSVDLMFSETPSAMVVVGE